MKTKNCPYFANAQTVKTKVLKAIAKHSKRVPFAEEENSARDMAVKRLALNSDLTVENEYVVTLNTRDFKNGKTIKLKILRKSCVTLHNLL